MLSYERKTSEGINNDQYTIHSIDMNIINDEIRYHRRTRKPIDLLFTSYYKSIIKLQDAIRRHNYIVIEKFT